MAKYVLGENSARKLKQLLNGKMNAGRIDGDGYGIVEDSDFMLPFTVQWAASVGDEGDWIIWLPGDEHVIIDDVKVDITASMTAAGGDYPAGFFCVGDCVDANGVIWLVVDLNYKTAYLSDVEGEGDDIVNIKVALTSVATDGARFVKMLVRSVVVIGSGTAPNDGMLTIKAYDGTVLGTFTANQAGNTVIMLPNIPAAANDGPLTIKTYGGVTLGTFTANQAGATVITLPEIPAAANDGLLTIKTYGGVTLGTFTANQAGATVITLPNIPAPLTGEVSYLGDIRYDLQTQQVQKRIDTLNLATGVVVQGNWVMITGGQAVPHASVVSGS